MVEAFPPLDYARSPYTGWVRAHWEAVFARLTYGYVLAANRSGSPARALFPDDRRALPDAVDALEGFARLSSAWGAWLSNPANPATIHYAGQPIHIEALMRQALVEGTDPRNPHTYWGDMDHMSQHIVEAANLGVSIWLSRERVFNTLTKSEQQQVMAWLAQVDGKQVYFDNWILFPAMAQMARLQLGYSVPLADLDAGLEQMAAFYRGDGWYADGAGAEFELYNPWMFHWHYLLWAWIDGDRRPNQRALVLERSRTFLATYPYFFGANGVYPAWGRSMVYRFAAVATFAAGYLLKITSDSPGRLRRLSSGCIRYFCEREMFDPEAHYLRQGFHGAYPPAGESYISPGSVYWACHGLFALAFDAADPFWTATEEPAPVEQRDFDIALAAPGLAVSGRRATGQVFLLNSRAGQKDDVEPDAGSGQPAANTPLTSEAELRAQFPPRHDYPTKYGKLVYSTHFPFNVSPVPGSYAPDAMLALTGDGVTFGHRSETRAGGVAPSRAWCEFDEQVQGRPQTIRMAVVLWNDIQVRLAYIRPTLPVRAFEAPGALGCAGAAGIVRRSSPEAGWEYAEGEGRALAIKRLWGFDGQCPSAPFLGYSNINLAYPYSEFPMVCETQVSDRPRTLASASLLRPASFNPGHEFAGLAVRAESDGRFHVLTPDGNTFDVDLRETTAVFS